MQTIGIRELRQQASKYLRSVERGETIQVTDHGRPVALITPIPSGNIVDRLAAAGQLRRGNGDPLGLGPPLKIAKGEQPLSSILEEMRADER